MVQKKSKNLKIRHKRAFSMIGYCLKCLLWDSPPLKHFFKRHSFGFCGYYWVFLNNLLFSASPFKVSLKALFSPKTSPHISSTSHEINKG
jgi:hypothetical protein